MNTPPPASTSGSDELCVVCGKSTAGGAGFMAIYVAGRRLPLCCPMCCKVYQENPVRYGGAAPADHQAGQSFEAKSP